jgi:DNA helicase-2/ATP-dependent DNA helicase PcrA
MGKRVILAVAGSGKTTYLVENIPKDKRSLLLAYTEANVLNLRNGIINRFGYFPDNICLKTYFSFLYFFCVQPFLKYQYKLNGLIYKENTNRYAKGDTRYMTKKRNLYYNRAAKFAEIKSLYQDIQKRLEKYYQYVSDFYQHTFDTSRDGNVKQSLHRNYDKYKNNFCILKFIVDEITLIKSYRCSPQICKYITDNFNICIESHKNSEIMYLDSKTEIENIVRNNDFIKLFRQEHYLYKCKSKNWEDCKGEDIYNDVCVVLNKKTLDHYFKNKLNELSPQTRNKLYVAISRAHGNVYFIAEKDLEDYKITV